MGPGYRFEHPCYQQPVDMGQSTKIAGVILLAFILYVIYHGQLTAYFQVLGI